MYFLKALIFSFIFARFMFYRATVIPKKAS